VKSLAVLCSALLVLALPFVFRRPAPEGSWKKGDPELVIISPHSEAIRYEFGRAFSEWHEDLYGKPVRVEWRVIGGTSEITRYLKSESQHAFKAWWKRNGAEWPSGGTRALTQAYFDAEGAEPELLELRKLFRETDDASAFSTGIDLFFGGGTYDHGNAWKQGISVIPWEGGLPDRLRLSSGGRELLPVGLSGERWRGEGYYGTALSTFGIVANLDRIQDLGVEEAPDHWRDLSDPRYRGQLGLADPTKSGSMTKAFEMMIHQQCSEAVAAAGFSQEDVDRFEANLELAPQAYHDALSQGWIEGLRLVRLIGANARYFTDSASKVAIDVSTGNAAVGLAIDFYGRYQAEHQRDPSGQERMSYVTPQGGSSVSADPISLLRGAPNRSIAVRFIEYSLGEGQRLWNFAPGTPGGPERYALRRLPLRRDLYPSEDPVMRLVFEETAASNVDDLSHPRINPYVLAEEFSYRGRWTGRLFRFHRHFIRASCMDAGEELRAAWAAIQEAGGAEAVPEAMDALMAMPPGLDWKAAHGPAYGREHRMSYMRDWVIFFRAQYRKAQKLAEAAMEASPNA